MEVSDQIHGAVALSSDNQPLVSTELEADCGREAVWTH